MLEGEEEVSGDRMVEEEEVENVVKRMKKNKTHGGDGLPVDFYVEFWPVLKDDLCEVIRTCMREKRVSASMKKGIITLLYKKKGDQRDIRNWRPISLLNSDYKIFAKLLADRMRRVVGSIIGEWQVCAVPGRRISDNLILLRNLVFYAQCNNMPLAVASIDLEKAYDRVAHKFLFTVLRQMGIPEDFVKLVECLYLGISSQVLVNGKLSKEVKVMSGVRQGCPLSPVTFICVMEPLLRHVGRDKCFKGMFVPGCGNEPVKTLCYMDDINFLCNTTRDVMRAEIQLGMFGAMSGLCVNWGKSSVCVLSGTCDVSKSRLCRRWMC